jgi:integrase
MAAYLRNGWWHYKKQIEGRTYTMALKIKRGMEDLLPERIRQVEKEITAKHYGLTYQKFESISMNEYIEKYVNQKEGKASLDRDTQRLEIISEVLGNPFLNEIGKSDILKLEKVLFSRNLEASTVNKYFQILRHFLNLSKEDGYLPNDNPARFYIPYVEKGSRRSLGEKEIKAIMKAAKRIQRNPKKPIQKIIYDLVTFAFSTGMRLGEIINLKKSYIQKAKNSFTIYYPISEVKHKRRTWGRLPTHKTIPLNDTAIKIIKRQKSQDGFVFQMPWRNCNAVFYAVHKIRKLSSVDDFCFHQIRHTVSSLIAGMTNIEVAKALLGHKDLKTTMGYTHPQAKEMSKAITKLDTYFSALKTK